jgi:ADP-heptose:LPS heptosyltransferase
MEAVRMNVARMRRLDRWFGVPVCWLLTLWRRLRFWHRPGRIAMPGRILFVKLAEQGSTVLAQGAFQAAIDRVGRDNVFFLCFAENRPVMDLLGLIPPDNVITIDARGLWSAVVGSVAALWQLRQAKIDTAIDLEFFARSSAALCFLSGARWRVGYHAFGDEASYRGDLHTHRLSFNPYLHTSQTFQILVEALDVPGDRLPTFAIEPPAPSAGQVSFQPDAREVWEMRQLLRGQAGGRLPPRLILLNANASDLIPLRRWPSERYIELARRLLARYADACVAFTGAPSESAAAEHLVEQVGSPRCISLAGRTTLRQLLVLCCLAEVLVTNDSGPAHFASLAPVQVVVLFGPETPRLFASTSPRTHALWAGLSCSPCINAFNDRKSPCRNNVCMQSISVDQVFSEVCRLYEGQQEQAWRRGRSRAA